MNKTSGLTLLEILVALFIFTILSMILVSTLHHVINLQSGTEANAERLRKVQMALLVMSRDIEQTANRPILNASLQEEAAFIGTPRELTFTHAGVAHQGIFRRVHYAWDGHSLWRTTWNELDLLPNSVSHSQRLLSEQTNARFEYLDKDNRFQDHWPMEQSEQALPRAVRVTLTFSTWGTLTQLYVISAQQNKTLPSAARS